MGKTVRKYWSYDDNDQRVIDKNHRDGKTGWVHSQRTKERLNKKAERKKSIRESLTEMDDDA